MFQFRSALAIVFITFIIAACSPTKIATPSAKIQVIATTSQLADIVQNVGGERITVVSLVPRNSDVHAFEPTTDDLRRAAASQAIFKNGAGLEGWLDKLIENVGGERPIFDVSAGLPLAAINDASQEGSQVDPHIWMNPALMVSAVDNIAAGLQQIDPQNAAEYQNNADVYKNKLRELDAWAAQQVATLPPEKRLLVTAHDSLGYFATRYGFKIVGYVIPSVSTQGQTSAKQLAELVDQIRATGVKTIFAEKSSNPKFLEQIAQDANVRVEELYIDSLGDVGGEAGTYIDFMRTDVTKIVNGLK